MTFVARGCLLALMLHLFMMADALAQFTMAPPPAPVLSNQTGLFHQPVQVTNTGTQARTDLRLFVTGLVAPVVLHNATGTLSGMPYLDYTTAIAAGATATVELRYYDPTLRMLSTPTVSVGSSTPGVELAITAPADQARLVTSPVNVTGTNSPGVNAITVNGRPATIAGTTWSISLPLHQGVNVVRATATGSTGQMQTATRTYFLETAPATIAVAFPADGARVTESSIAVSGVINDVVPGTINAGQMTVTVNGLAARVANRTFAVPAVPLQPGLNSILVIGTDPEGNTSRQTVRVTYLPPEGNAVLRMVSGNNQSGVISQEAANPLVVRVQNAAGQPVGNVPVAFRVQCNDGLVKDGARSARALVVNSDAGGLASVRWLLGSRSGAGCNVVEVTATGYAGRADFIAEGLQGGPARINVEANNNQVGQTGQPLRQPLMVAVTDAGFNRKSGVPVTFTVTEGSGIFDNGQTSFTVNTNSDGRAGARLVLGPGDGRDNNRVTANFPANPGQAAVFVASGFTPGAPANTAVTGVVLDNTDQPIQGATLSISGTALTTTSNAQGQFRLQGVPVGHVQLTANGTTAQRPGTWPTIEFELTTVSGRDNDLGQPIYLLPLDLGNGVPVTELTGGVLTLPAFPGFKLEIAPGSVTFPGGARSGLISVTAVHADKVPMTPGFGQQPRFIVTVQPANAIFDPPARLTLPNSDSLAPGAITEMYSFDHDIRQFVAIGTGHVSEDGSVIVSDPGIGIVKAGWHCGGNPQEVAAGITSTVTVSSANVSLQVGASQVVTATGSPTPPHDNPYEWMKSFNDAAGAPIPAGERGDINLAPAPAGGNSATITGTKCGKVAVKVRYRCKSAQWSAYATVIVNVSLDDNQPVAITWDAADYSSENAAGDSETTNKPFVVEYDACVDPVAGKWRMRVRKVTGDVTIVVRYGGSRNPISDPPATEAEAQAAVLNMKGYYARGSRGAWHTEAASRTHEEHHYLEWQCSSDHYWPVIEPCIEALNVPAADHATKAAAIAAMKPAADALVASFTAKAREYWFILPDNASSRPYAAGQNRLNAAILSVQNLATMNGWVVQAGTDSPSSADPCFLPWLAFNPCP